MADDGRALLREIVRAQRRRVVGAALGGVAHQACEALVPVLIGVGGWADDSDAAKSRARPETAAVFSIRAS